MSYRKGGRYVQGFPYQFGFFPPRKKGDYGSCMTEVTEENGQMKTICMGCKQADACQRAKAENFWDYLSKCNSEMRNHKFPWRSSVGKLKLRVR